jgi:hypothetical protein
VIEAKIRVFQQYLREEDGWSRREAAIADRDGDVAMGAGQSKSGVPPFVSQSRSMLDGDDDF